MDPSQCPSHPFSSTRRIQPILTLAFACLGVLLFPPQLAKAVNISWGTGLDQTFFDSAGSDLTGSFTAYLGYFTSAPLKDDIASLEAWNTNFVVFDSTDVHLNPDAGADYFTSSANLNAAQESDGTGANPASVFPDGTQAYVWVRNQTAVNENMEWLLFTDTSWDFPAGTDTHTPGDVEWFLSATPNTDVWGMTNYDGTTYDLPTAPEVRVEPDKKDPFAIQTGTIIPEPSSSLFALLGLTVIMMQRRRR